METIDFRTWKQKRNSFFNTVEVGIQNTYYKAKRTIEEHPAESLIFFSAVASGTASLAKSLVRMHNANLERRYDNRHEYDNRTSTHWYAKKDISTKQRLEIERRYNQGESKGHIMKSMGLI